MQDMSRRNFVKGSVATAATAAAMGATVASAEEVAWQMPEWDEAADVIIVGFGGAGAMAAVAAIQAGSSVIVLEKCPWNSGGNTGTSSGSIHTAAYSDPEEWIAKVKHGCFGTTPDSTIEAMIPEALATPDWLAEIGLDIKWGEPNKPSTTRPSYRGGSIQGYPGTEGRYLWQAITDVCDNWGVDVRFATPAKKLIQNPATKDVIGVVAEDAEGKQIVFKANKGVILACGGYENNPWMQGQFNYPGIRLFPWGTPYNTGDGFAMVSEVGAELWHMHGLEFSAISFKKPSLLADCSISTNATTGIQPYNHIFVNQEGKRFMNEAKGMNHDIESKPAMDFGATASEYKNVPLYMVFDQTMYDYSPLWIGTARSGIVNTYAGVYNGEFPETPICDWPSNDAAVEKGWIYKADTIEELAAQMCGTRPCGEELVGVDAEALKATIEEYNALCAAGEGDPVLGRAADKMLPLDNPPYYAIELSFSCINTQGGPVRNEFCQSMGYDKQPIPRLYNVGEFGSFNGYVYVCGNIFEALWTGRIAGQHAAALEAWA